MKATICDKCKGTGEYRFVSKRDGKTRSGMCYQCQGKGHMTTADDRRTSRYWVWRALHAPD